MPLKNFDTFLPNATNKLTSAIGVLGEDFGIR